MEGVKGWLAPLTGALAVAALVGGFAIAGETPDATEESAQQVAQHYIDNDDEVFIGSILVGLGGLLMLYFGGWLRRLLRDAEGPTGILSAVAFAGTIVFATGVAVVATLGVALADSADDIDPVAMQALNAFSWNYFIPFAMGISALLFATGLSVIRHGALPAWLGWVALVLGVAAFTPAGFFGAIGGAIWIVVVSVMSAVQGRGTPTPR